MDMEKTTKPKYSGFIECDDGNIVELVGDKDVKMFLVANVLSEKWRLEEQFEYRGQLYFPPKDDLVQKGTVLLPTAPEEYGDLQGLIWTIEEFIYKYLDVSDGFRKIASYYVLLTWVFDSFEVLPYLRTLGDYGSGKTRFQKVIGSLCYRPMFAGGATTPSPIFRIIDIYRGTLILDEADFRFSDSDAEIIKIFNCGYCKGIPVLRTEGGDRTERMPVSYDVYGPKIIGTRKKFDDPALESRCLTEVMQGNSRKDIPIHLPKSFDSEALKIRNMLLFFRIRHYGQISVDPDLVISGVESRMNQIILPILSIVKDEDARKEIVDFISRYAGQLKSERSDELPACVLKIMLTMVSEGVTLGPKEIARRLNEGRDKEQGEYLISPTKVGKINSSNLNFKTRQVRGVTEILWDGELARKLCFRYGIEEPETLNNADQQNSVDHVEDVEDLGMDDSVAGAQRALSLRADDIVS